MDRGCDVPVQGSNWVVLDVKGLVGFIAQSANRKEFCPICFRSIQYFHSCLVVPVKLPFIICLISFIPNAIRKVICLIASAQSVSGIDGNSSSGLNPSSHMGLFSFSIVAAQYEFPGAIFSDAAVGYRRD